MAANKKEERKKEDSEMDKDKEPSTGEGFTLEADDDNS